MGFYVHIQVSFACDHNDAVAALAAKHLERNDGLGFDAKSFLEDLASRSGPNNGPKGGVSLWGWIGNYTIPDEFVSSLSEFWLDLLRGVDGGPSGFERVIVLSELEQSEQAVAHEIWIEDESGGSVALRSQRHKLPFSWMQF